MKRLLVAGTIVVGLVGRVYAGDLTLWYDKPANKGMNEALPIGNGTFGGLIYAGPKQERVVLNEISLWTGTEISSDDYSKMGSYQMLGELLVDVAPDPATRAMAEPTVICASGHKAFFETEEIAASVDGDPGTKWCVEHQGKPVIWEVRLPQGRVVDRYSFTSADDMPSRDPSTWELIGSDDGKTWTTLDRHENEPPFANRHETKTYTCRNATAFRCYRLTFAPNQGVSHFQVAEISIPGETVQGKETTASVQNYRRSLDLATAIHTVTYQSGAVTFQREAFASHRDQVMVLKFSADRPGACTGTVQLRGAHKEITAATGTSLTFAGSLDNGLKYEAKLLALNEGGTLQAGDGKIEFKNCNSITFLVAAGTDYALDYAHKYRGDDPQGAIEKRLASAAVKKYDDLKAAHVAEYQSYFNRVALDVGATPADRLALKYD